MFRPAPTSHLRQFRVAADRFAEMPIAVECVFESGRQRRLPLRDCRMRCRARFHRDRVRRPAGKRLACYPFPVALMRVSLSRPRRLISLKSIGQANPLSKPSCHAFLSLWISASRKGLRRFHSRNASRMTSLAEHLEVCLRSYGVKRASASRSSSSLHGPGEKSRAFPSRGPSARSANTVRRSTIRALPSATSRSASG